MVYLVGIIGLISGFITGQMLLYFMLRHRSRDELLNDRHLKWTYGLLNWVVAGIMSWSFVAIYLKYYAAS